VVGRDSHIPRRPGDQPPAVLQSDRLRSGAGGRRSSGQPSCCEAGPSRPRAFRTAPPPRVANRLLSPSAEVPILRTRRNARFCDRIADRCGQPPMDESGRPMAIAANMAPLMTVDD
jgi:hypothetical protein